MIFIFAYVCDSPALTFLVVVSRIMNILKIVGPILCIVSLIFSFVKLISNPDDKKLLPRIKNSIIALFALFFIPTIVGASVAFVGGTLPSDCISSYKNISYSMDYVEIDENKRKSILGDYEYERGTPVENNNNNTGNNNSTNTGNTRVNTSTSNSGRKIVFIGDSRTVQMYARVVNSWKKCNYSSGGVHEVGEDVFIAQGSQGLKWLKSTGIPEAKKYFGPNTYIIILMGVNDLNNANSYIKYLNGNIDSWSATGSRVYFVAVTPCNNNRSGMNSKIKTFNSKLKGSLSGKIRWLDAYSYLTKNGFGTTDGLHYNTETSLKIYKYIKNNL